MRKAKSRSAGMIRGWYMYGVCIFQGHIFPRLTSSPNLPQARRGVATRNKEARKTGEGRFPFHGGTSKNAPRRWVEAGAKRPWTPALHPRYCALRISTGRGGVVVENRGQGEFRDRGPGG